MQVVLYCIVMYCIVLYCIALYCKASSSLLSQLAYVWLYNIRTVHIHSLFLFLI